MVVLLCKFVTDYQTFKYFFKKVVDFFITYSQRVIISQLQL